jgi:LuxR family maltose regulon positive regulatory protein
MGESMYQSGQLNAGELNFEWGLEHVVRHGDAYSIIEGYSTLALIQIAKGEVDQAIALFNELELIIGELSPSKNAHKIYDAWKAYALILIGEWEQAKEWIKRPGYDELEGKYLLDLESHSYVGIYRVSQTPINFYSDFFRMTQARLLLAMNGLVEGLNVIEKLLSDMERGSRLKYKVESLIVKSIFLYRLDQKNKAIDSILEAIHHGAKEGYVQVFLNDGENLKALLEEIKEMGSIDIEEQVFVLRLLEDIQVEKQRKKIRPNDDLVQLTPREIEVLECLVSGKSYSQAAEHLLISINTLKTHTRRIYQKLGVNGLMQALNKAKTLNIIN